MGSLHIYNGNGVKTVTKLFTRSNIKIAYRIKKALKDFSKTTTSTITYCSEGRYKS
jgi:hypothetical protein